MGNFVDNLGNWAGLTPGRPGDPPAISEPVAQNGSPGAPHGESPSGRPEAAQQAMRIASAEGTKHRHPERDRHQLRAEGRLQREEGEGTDALRARLAYSPQDSAVLSELAQSLIQRRSLQEPTGDPAETLAAASVPRADRPGRP